MSDVFILVITVQVSTRTLSRLSVQLSQHSSKTVLRANKTKFQQLLTAHTHTIALGMCTFPEVNTSQSSNIVCSSEYMNGPVYTSPDLSHCSLYGRVECQAKMSAFSQGLMIDSRCKNEVDHTWTATVNCTLMKDGNSSVCWKLYIYFPVGCERTNGSVIPLVGSWTKDFNREHFCLYIMPPKIAGT